MPAWRPMEFCRALRACDDVVGRLASKSGTRRHLEAGAAKVDITNLEAGPVNDRLYVKALVLQIGSEKPVIVTVDAVAIGEIGRIGNDYLPNVRARVETELGIKPSQVMVNASHCHGIVCEDVDERTVQAIRQAHQNLVPVRVGVGVGHEDRIMENRRIKLKSGRVVDVRHAYSLPPDERSPPSDRSIRKSASCDSIARMGEPWRVVYNFACHPIQGVPSGGNTADITGFASQVIEDNLSEGTIALFLQGCGGDINPVLYKDVNNPRMPNRWAICLG